MIKYTIEDIKRELLGNSMPMIAGKMSKSGECENVEYIPLSIAVGAILSTRSKLEEAVGALEIIQREVKGYWANQHHQAPYIFLGEILEPTIKKVLAKIKEMK